MFLTFDLGPDGKGKIPVAQVKSLLDNNRFNVQFDDYQRRGQKTLDVIKQESICYFNNVRQLLSSDHYTLTFRCNVMSSGV